MSRRKVRSLTVTEVEAYVASTCFKTGPPRKLGVELEMFVLDLAQPGRPLEGARTRDLASAAGVLPGGGLLSIEPGGQLELSSAPADSLGACVSAVSADLAHLYRGAEAAGLTLLGAGVDPYRLPRRVLDLPRYVAMETFFDSFGPDGREMMCGTASVQVCVDAGQPEPPAGREPAGAAQATYRRRWELLHTLAPVLIAAFANSPLRAGRPTGWKSFRQAVWSRMEPSRTMPPRAACGCLSGHVDPREVWARYALDARVLCVRPHTSEEARRGPWLVPSGLTLRDWADGCGPRPLTRGDVDYHLTTLFPPVRPRGFLELRFIDAQPGPEGWVVPAAVVTALLDDPAAADAAREATEILGRAGARGLWTRAARDGLADPLLRRAAELCFAAAGRALAASATPGDPVLAGVRAAVESFADTYVTRGRCPADDRLAEWRSGWPRRWLPRVPRPQTQSPDGAERLDREVPC
jgi:glutamate--cysteine ligase